MEEDRISFLPEEIRNHILSFLPTIEDAIRTSILSTKWRKVCSTLTHLLFDQRRRNDDNFIDFIHQTLSQHVDHDSGILKFKLLLNAASDHDTFLPHIPTWINFATSHNVRQIELCSLRERTVTRLNNKLPVSLFTCNSLTFLKLRNIHLNDSSTNTISFPNLITLYLWTVEFVDFHSSIQLFSSSPLLENLYVMLCSWKNPINILTIPAPNLKFLSVMVSGRSLFHEIVHSSTNLHEILYRGGPMNFNLETIPSLYIAHVDVPEQHTGSDHWASKILMGLHNVAKLYLGGFFIEYLVNEQNLLEHLPTSSGCMKHLVLYLVPTKNQVQVTKFLLRCYPNLQILHIFVKTARGHDTLNTEEYWKTQELYTDGILKQLKSIEIVYFIGSEIELNLVQFLLENANALEKMNIILLSLDESNYVGITEKIQRLTRVSPHAAISFSEK